eukprot:3835893-Rhodomonas_salina.1
MQRNRKERRGEKGAGRWRWIRWAHRRGRGGEGEEGRQEEGGAEATRDQVSESECESVCVRGSLEACGRSGCRSCGRAGTRTSDSRCEAVRTCMHACAAMDTHTCTIAHMRKHTRTQIHTERAHAHTTSHSLAPCARNTHCISSARIMRGSV